MDDRGGLPGTQQSRTGLRHHLHLGIPRVRPPGRLDGRLGHHRRRRHRDGQPRPDSGLLLVHLRRRTGLEFGVRTGQQHDMVDGGRRHLDHRDDLHLLPGHRGVGPPAVRTARHRNGHSSCLRRGRAVQGLHQYRRDVLDQALAGLVLAGRVGLHHGDRPGPTHRPLHLLGLGYRGGL